MAAYQGVSNDFCIDWLPHMTNLGYELVAFHGRHKYADPGGAAGPNARHAVARGTFHAHAYCKLESRRRGQLKYAEGEAYFRLNTTDVPEPPVGWRS